MEKQLAHELNGILYDSSNKDLCVLLECIRQKNHNPDEASFRIRVHWIGGFRPYSGYIVKSKGRSVSVDDETVYTPLLAWNRKSRRGKPLDPSLIERIEFANKSMGNVIWDRYEGFAPNEDLTIEEWINDAAIIQKGAKTPNT